VFGEGHAARPLPTFLALEAISFVAYFAAVEIVRRTPARAWHFPFVLAVGLACRLLFAPAAMIQEVDPYRYVWDGQTVMQGANPYVHAPEEAYEQGEVPAVALGEAGEQVYERINYRGVPTIYPPAAQALFAVSQWLTPWGLGGWKVLLFVAEAGSVGLVACALVWLRRPLAWTLVYAWSPLVLKEFSNSLHLDAFVVLGLSGLILAVLRGRALLAFGALAWISLLKLFSVALLPLLVALEWRRSPRRAGAGLGFFMALVALAYLPWMDAGFQLFDGLLAFAQRWQRNDSLFTVASALVGDQARPLCAVLIGACVAGATVLVFLTPKPMQMNAASLGVIVAIFAFAPTANPWYFTWTLPFVVLFPSRALLLLSGLLFGYYADFYFLYRDQPGLFDVVRLAEYLPFYAVLCWELWRVRHRIADVSRP